VDPPALIPGGAPEPDVDLTSPAPWLAANPWPADPARALPLPVLRPYVPGRGPRKELLAGVEGGPPLL